MHSAFCTIVQLFDHCNCKLLSWCLQILITSKLILSSSIYYDQAAICRWTFFTLGTAWLVLDFIFSTVPPVICTMLSWCPWIRTEFTLGVVISWPIVQIFYFFFWPVKCVLALAIGLNYAAKEVIFSLQNVTPQPSTELSWRQTQARSIYHNGIWHTFLSSQLPYHTHILILFHAQTDHDGQAHRKTGFKLGS